MLRGFAIEPTPCIVRHLKVYYFEFTLSPDIVWFDLNDLDFAPNSGVRAVPVESDYSLIGNINADLAPVQPIALLAP